MAGFCVNLAWLPDNTAFCFSLSKQRSQIAHASTIAFVCGWVGRRHDKLHFAMVVKTPCLFGHHKLLRSRI